MIKRCFTILYILLITATLYLGVHAFYKINMARRDQVQQVQPARKPVPPREGQTHRPMSYYRIIIDRNLFNTKQGVEEKPKNSKNIKLEGLEQTRLNLKLWGTVTGDSGKTYAVIEDVKNRDQNLYIEGDTIQNAAIKLILREKVVLRVNGKDEILQMEEAQSSRKTKRSPMPLSTAQPRKLTLRRSQIEDAATNLDKLMKEVKLTPHLKNGQPDGFTLTGIKPRSIFRKMGLRNGDVIKSIDGQPLTSMDNAMKLYENLTSSSNVTIQLKRRGRLRTIDYTIE